MADDEWEDVTPRRRAPAADDEWETVSPPAAQSAPVNLRPRSESMTDEQLGIGRGLEIGKPRVLGAPGGPSEPGKTAEERAAAVARENPLAEDWGGQAVIGGVLGAGAGNVAAAGARALGAAPAVARIAASGVAGGTSSKVQGGDFTTGAVLGAGLQGAGEWFKGAPERAAARIYQQYGQAASGVDAKTKVMEIGPRDVTAVAQRYGIDRVSPQNAVALTKKGLSDAGGTMGDALDSIGKAGGEVDMGKVARVLDDLQQKFGSRSGSRPFARDVAELRGELLERYGTKGTITPAQLHDEISGLENSAYGGKYTDPTLSRSLQRQTAGVLDRVLDEHIATAAKRSPAAAQAAEKLAEATRDYRVLKTLEPIIQSRAVASEFQKSLLARFAQAPGRTVASTAVGAVTAPFRSADVALARLMAARQSGAVTPQMIDEAVRAGVRSDIVATLAGPRRDQMGAMVPVGAP